MKASTVIRHARKLRQICRLAEHASHVGVTRIHGDVIVGDLPEFTFARIGAWSQAWRLEGALREWIDEQRAITPRDNVVRLHPANKTEP